MDDALLHKLQNSHLDDDNDKRHDDSDHSDDDQDQSIGEVEVPNTMRETGPQTGPKGVIADEKYHRQMRAAQKQADLTAYNAKMLAKAPMTTTYLEDQRQAQASNELVLESRHDSDSDLDDLLEDEEQHRVFGTLADVDAQGYVDAIDNEWRTVPVVVHVFDSNLQHCRQLDALLQPLARKYALAKFIRIAAHDLDFDLVGSPAILAYKSGILVANLIRLDDEVGPVYSEETIEDLLIRHQALSEEDLYDQPEKDDSTDDE
ncbi:thioredoxin-like protein [Hesseltinella vesiculosa]|uniref:Thioredoxin-like protein n=1 Tax=Hesseltinella vesiculosa TaxID=101127 RepID=A0A1X2G9Z6_9FUNG|nr:thioredoxin-like protein [Hesseltinella vesiculosa]